MDRCHYIHKMNAIFQDESKFQEVNIEPWKMILKLQDKTTRLLKKLKDTKRITKAAYDEMNPCGTKLGTAYGLVKTHKDGNPMRPIVSAVKTHNYEMAKSVGPLIDRWSTAKYTTQDAFQFVQEVTQIPNADRYFMTSFDIKSLYPSVPLRETIDIIMKKAY